MTFSPTTSYAAGKFSSAKNEIFAQEPSVLPRKMVLIGTYDPAKTAVVDEVPVDVFSPEQVAATFGDGFMLHRLSIAAFKGGQGLPVTVIPQAETGGSQATGTITFTTSGTLAGTMYLYIAGEDVPFLVAAGDDAEAIATACVAAINADSTLPVTAANTLGVVTVTSKSEGPWGDDISIAFDLADTDSSNAEITAVVVAMSGGAGVPDISDALNALGTNDNQNEDNYTAIQHGYGNESGVLDKVSTYNGAGNDFIGNYAKEVGRPFRSLIGDVAVGSSGLTAAKAVGDGRKLDRTSGLLSVPGSQSHPQEIACLAMAIMELANNTRAQDGYIDRTLPGVWPGARGADRWSSDYDNRESAVLSGVSPTMVKNGVVVLQDVVSFYHPDNVPLANNGYKSMRHISIVQNLLKNNYDAFNTERWQNVSIVADKAFVTSAVDRAKVVDANSVRDQMISLATNYGRRAWLYDASYTIGRINSDASLVTTRTDARGFIVKFPVILSGEMAILDFEAQFDVSIAILQ